MLKAYIAGPFFNNEERTYLNEMISWVKEHYKNVELYIPMEHEIINGVQLPNKIWAKKVYDEDVQAINNADLVFIMSKAMTELCNPIPKNVTVIPTPKPTSSEINDVHFIKSSFMRIQHNVNKKRISISF